MTAPQPSPPRPGTPADPMTKDRLAGEFCRILSWRYGTAEPQVVAALLLAAGQYAAHMIELYARPDDRWRPQ